MGRRAVGIVRVSQVAGREGESFVSPGEQRDRIAAACDRDGLELVETIEELDVSGGTPLAKREGLRRAVESVEAGTAEVIVAAYFDRLVRSLKVQEEVVSRVEAAGGRVLALDFGEVTGESAAKWLSSTVLGMLGEYQRRSTAERAGAAQARAVARGVLPHPAVPPGYVRGPDGVLQIDAATAPAVLGAFQLRAQNATIKRCRAFLRDHGIERSYHGVQSMFSNRLYLGEVRFGRLVNLQAHEPLVDQELFDRVQRVAVPRGKQPQSDRLLARLGVLRCGVCDSRMVVGIQTQQGRRYPFYRCSTVCDCIRRQTIAIAYGLDDDRLGDLGTGRASAGEDARLAAVRAEADQANLDRAIQAFTGLEDEASARDKLAELRRIRDDSRAEAHRLAHLSAGLTISPGADWDSLSREAQRDFIRAVVERAVVMPGKRGAGRIRVELRR